jgi:hypothetical protein
MPRKAAVQKEPTLAPERAFRALTQQLDSLQKLKNRRYDEADSDKTEWEHLTEGIIQAAFGDPSSALSKFRVAKSARYYEVGSSESWVRELEALLRSLVNILRLQLPEEEIQGFYEPGDEYAFYRDLSSLIQEATQDVLFVDAYLDEKVFDLYVSKVSRGVKVRILSNNIAPKVVTVARMYARASPLELRSSANIHDRAIFLDQRGWITGQSIKDAAKKKPTYLIELDEPLLAASRDIYNGIWAVATVVM